MKCEFNAWQRGLIGIACATFFYCGASEVGAYGTTAVGPSPLLFQGSGQSTTLPSWYRSIYGASIFSGDLLGDGSTFIGFTSDNHPGINLLVLDGSTWVAAGSSGTGVEPFSVLDNIESVTLGTSGTLANFSGTARRDLILGARGDNVAEEIRYDGKKRTPVASGVAWFRYSTADGFVKQHSFFPFGQDYSGGVNVAAGDVTGDGIDEIIVAKNAGNRPDVAIFTKEGSFLYSFSVFEAEFRGGVNVAAVDFTRDGRDEVVVVPQSAREAEVRIVNSTTGAVLHSFIVFPGQKSGASVSVHEAGQHIVVGTTAGVSPQVQEYNLYTSVLDGVNIAPYQSGFRGGVEVAYLPTSNHQFVVAHGAKHLTKTQLLSYDWWFDSKPKGRLRKDGTPIPALFDADGKVLAEYGAVPPGSSVSVADVDGDGTDEVAFGSPPGRAPRVWLYRSSGKLIRSFPVFDTKLRTGITVALVPKVGDRGALVFVTPRNGAQSVVRQYTIEGAYTGKNFRVHAPSFTKGIMLIVGHFQGGSEYEIVTLPRKANLPMKLFSIHGKLLRQRSIKNSQQPVVPYASSIAVLPDANGDGTDDIVHFSGPPNSIVFYTSFSGRTLETLLSYQDAENWLTETPPFQALIRSDSAEKNFGQITASSVGGRTKLAFGLAGNVGPVIVATGPLESDRNIITTYPSTWKGAVTPASLPHGYRGADAYVVVGGRPIDTVTWTRDVNFLQPSVVPAGQVTVAKSLSGKLPHGTYRAQVVIANLKSKKLQVRTVVPKCKGKCAAPMSSYVKNVRAFASINATGPYPYQLRANPYDPKTAGKLVGFTQQNFGTITFSNTNEWYTTVADGVLRDNYKGIRSNFFASVTGQRPVAGWSLGGGGRSPGSLIGVRGGDLYFITYSTTGGGVADREFINSFNFVYVGENDGGGAIALYHRGAYLAGPGRNITGALLLTAK